jgi:SAM-dependent methyltransferase
MESNPTPQSAPREILLEQDDVQMIQSVLGSGDPRDWLQIPQIRYKLAYLRAQRMANKETQVLSDKDSAVIVNTIEHNLAQIGKGAALGRCDLLINVLKSIERVTDFAERNQILCVGPRTEAEILGLVGAGFPIANVRGLDLISYSPLVDLGDMHNMPYPDKSFDVIILGWVIGYSTDNARVAKEVRRVAKSGAVVAVGCEYEPKSAEDLKSMGVILEGDGPKYYNSQQYLDLFKDEIDTVFFRHDVPRYKMGRSVSNIMAVFQLK